MKTHAFRLPVYFLLLLLLPGCSVFFGGINAVGETFFADDYVLTNADGTRTKVWNLAKDGSARNRTSTRIEAFSAADHKRLYQKEEQHQFQELTVSNLKEIAQQNQLTLVTKWLPHCGPSHQEDLLPFMKMVVRLKEQNVEFNKG
ncbi:MAG: hypothetical protein LPK19_14770, partial [Hymenobacteraceae bacterium]|nr:hypothetical protein [Hymenobacteraceae bacterium]MDX5397496.1 hypothetical protein [Hymenobacteraceae bacterium]MDX5513572.1 hypothetical protein [Hymenobacteraceae bacterium]